MYSEPTTCTVHVQSASYMCTVSQLHVYLHTVCKPLYMYNVHTGSQLHVLYLWLHVHTFVHCTLCWLPACIHKGNQHTICRLHVHVHLHTICRLHVHRICKLHVHTNVQYAGYMYMFIHYAGYIHMYTYMYRKPATCTVHMATCTYTVHYAGFLYLHCIHTGSQHTICRLHVHTICWLHVLTNVHVQYAGYIYIQEASYMYIQYVGYMCIQYVSYMYIQMYNMQATCTCSYTMQATYTCIHTCTGSQLHVLYIWLHVHTLYTMLASCMYTYRKPAYNM